MNPKGIIERLMTALGLQTQTQLASSLDIRPQSIVSAVKRGDIPEAWLYRVAYRTGRSFEWLRTGKGPIWRENVIAEAPAAYGRTGAPVALRRILEVWQELGIEEQTAVQRCAELLGLEDRDIRAHLVNQLKLIAETASVRRAKRSRRRAKGSRG
jgi:hypothetical protein